MIIPLLLTLARAQAAEPLPATTSTNSEGRTVEQPVQPDKGGRVGDQMIAVGLFGDPGEHWSTVTCDADWARERLTIMGDRPLLELVAKRRAEVPATVTCTTESLRVTWTLVPSP